MDPTLICTMCHIFTRKSNVKRTTFGITLAIMSNICRNIICIYAINKGFLLSLCYKYIDFSYNLSYKVKYWNNYDDFGKRILAIFSIPVRIFCYKHSRKEVSYIIYKYFKVWTIIWKKCNSGKLWVLKTSILAFEVIVLMVLYRLY